MAFRAKSADRAVADIVSLSEQYGTFQLEAVDNILDPQYVESVFQAPALVSRDLSIFFEVKADLSRDQLRQLSRAGVDRVQPGIESLNSHVLALMRKGTRAATNVNFLRWAGHFGITATWNIIWGFPGETEEDYEEQARLVPLLYHLQPPVSTNGISVDRFSPIFAEPEQFGASNLLPHASYEYAFPSYVDTSRTAYYFQCEFSDALAETAYKSLTEEVERWRRRWVGLEAPTMTCRSMPGRVEIRDRRKLEAPADVTLTDGAADLYRACFETPRSFRQLADCLPDIDVEVELENLKSQGLIMVDGRLALALATPEPGRVVRGVH